MLKLMGVLFLVTGTIGLSLERIREETKRIKNLKQIKNFTIFLMDEIFHSHIPIPDICEEYVWKSEGSLKAVLEKVSEEYRNHQGKSFEVIWEETIYRICEQEKLSKEEKSHLLQLSRCFGYSNAKGQLSAIEQYLQEVENDVLQREKKFQDNRKLIIYFGVMSGLFISILLL